MRTVCECLAEAVGVWGVDARWVGDPAIGPLDIVDVKGAPLVVPGGGGMSPRMGRGVSGAAGMPAGLHVEQPRRITYCLAEASPYAVMVGDRKLCGLAARRYRAGWLIQGSLLLHPLPPLFTDVMPAPVYDALVHRAIPLDAAAGTPVEDEDVAEELFRVWRARQNLPSPEPAQGLRDREPAYAV